MIIFGICLICVLAGLFVYARYCEKKLWNNGACPCGKGFWKSFDMDSQGGIGYRCTHCGDYIWITYHGVTR